MYVSDSVGSNMPELLSFIDWFHKCLNYYFHILTEGIYLSIVSVTIKSRSINYNFQRLKYKPNLIHIE